MFTRCWHCWCLRRHPHVGVLLLCVHLRPSCLYMTDLGGLDVRHGAATGTQRLSASCYQNVLWPFQHCVFVVPLLLLAASVGFLLLAFDEENVFLLKYNQSRITRARDKQVEEDQD